MKYFLLWKNLSCSNGKAELKYVLTKRTVFSAKLKRARQESCRLRRNHLDLPTVPHLVVRA